MKKLLASTLLGLLVLAPAMAQNDLNGPSGTARPVQSAYYSAAQGAPQIGLNSPGSYFGQVFNVSGVSGTWALGYNTVMTANGSALISWNTSGQVGIGTSVPANTTLLDIASTTGEAEAVRVRNNGLMEFHANSVPTAGTCGTSPSAVSGSDQAGDVTIGTSVSGGGSCTITFKAAFTNIPHCFCSNRTTSVPCIAKATATTVVLAGTATNPFVATDALDYACFGHQ